MKKILLSLLLIPMFAFQTNNTIIDLKEQGLNATIVNNTSFTDLPEVKPNKNNSKDYFEINIRFNGDASLEIARIPPQLTAQKAMAELNKMLKIKHEGFSIKAIKKGTDFLLTERKMEDEITYKAMYVTAQKGKNFLVSSNNANDLATCEQLLAMAKTLKLK